jgi:hypothetical protein
MGKRCYLDIFRSSVEEAFVESIESLQKRGTLEEFEFRQLETASEYMDISLVAPGRLLL